MIILAGRDQFAEWVVHFVADKATGYIGEHYFGVVGAILAPLAAYYALKKFESKRQPEPVEPEENKDVLKELGDQLERSLVIVVLRVAICGLIGFGGALVWELLARFSPAVRALGGDRGSQTVWLAVAAIGLLWFYRSSWRNPVVGFCAVVAGVLLLKFGWFDLTPWLVALGLFTLMIALILVYRTPWSIAIVASGLIIAGFYLSDREVPIGPIGFVLLFGGGLLLILASRGVTAPGSTARGERISDA